MTESPIIPTPEKRNMDAIIVTIVSIDLSFRKKA
jgi:hypothetical protein